MRKIKEKNDFMIVKSDKCVGCPPERGCMGKSYPDINIEVMPIMGEENTRR